MHFGFLMPVAGFWTTHPVQLAAAIIVAATAMACAAGSLYAARVWRRTPADRQGLRRRLAVADTVFAVAAVVAAVSTVAQVAAWGANWGTDVRDAGADRRRAEEAASPTPVARSPSEKRSPTLPDSPATTSTAPTAAAPMRAACGTCSL